MVDIVRSCEPLLLKLLSASPAVMLVGARQTGKSSLARKIAAARASVFFDLERADDLRKLASPGAELRRHKNKLVIIDEVQHLPDLFREIRTIIDEMRAEGSANGRFLLLGSVAAGLQRQSESLTGRIMELQLHPFNLLELLAAGGMDALLPWPSRRFTPGIDGVEDTLALLWERGGYPESVLATDEEQSLMWRQGYLANAIKKDARPPGARVPEEKYRELLQLIADKQRSITPKQEFARQLGFSKNDAIDAMLATLEQMMLIRRLPAYTSNIKQQVRKSSKYYICDSGLHQCLLNRSIADLAGEDSARKWRGGSWEGFVIQNIASALPRGWHCFYLGFDKGREIDLIVEKPGGAIWAIEIKSGHDPVEHQRGIVDRLCPERSFLVHEGSSRYRGGNDSSIVSLHDMMNELRAHDPDRRGQNPHSDPDIRQASPQYQAAVTALGRDDRLLNIRRDSFIAAFVEQAGQCFGQAAGAGDRDARNLWVQNRNELLEWLKLESRIEPEGRKARQWQRLLCTALEKIADGAHRRRHQGQYDFYGTFPRLCCHDLFVHVTAVLVENGCHEFLHRLTARRYCVGDSMLAFICFWSGAPKDLAGIARLSEEDKRQTVAEFVVSQACVQRAKLLQAELLLFVSGMVLCEKLLAENKDGHRAASGDFCWDPWLLISADAVPPLPFFQQTENREGMENFLSCLGIAPSAAGVAQLRKTVAKYLEKKLRYLTGSREDFQANFLCCLNLENWHDQFSRGRKAGSNDHR